MRQYLDLLRHVQQAGVHRPDRTGTGTTSVFGYQMRFDLARGFPLLTTKKVFTRSVFGELLWFLRGDTNVGWLHDHDIHIWDEWADEAGDLGPIYGSQWRSWPAPDGGSIDQIANVIQPDQGQPVLAATHRKRLEPGTGGRHGAASLPHAVPVLRDAGRAG